MSRFVCFKRDHDVQLICRDASLAVQSEKASTLIENVIQRFQAGMPISYNQGSPRQVGDYSSQFQDKANFLTSKREGFKDENVDVAEGFESDLQSVVSSDQERSRKEGTASAGQDLGKTGTQGIVSNQE